MANGNSAEDEGSARIGAFGGRAAQERARNKAAEDAEKVKATSEADKAATETRRQVLEAAAIRKAEQREQREQAAIARTEAVAASKRREAARQAKADRDAATRKAESERLKIAGRREDKGSTVAVGGEGEGRREASTTEREAERLRTETVVISSLATVSNRQAEQSQERVQVESKAAQDRLAQAQKDEQKRLERLSAKAQAASEARNNQLVKDQKKAQSEIDEFVRNLEFRAESATTTEQVKELGNQKRIAEKEIALIITEFENKLGASSAAGIAANKAIEAASAAATAKISRLGKSETEQLTSLSKAEQSKIDDAFKAVKDRSESFNKASGELSADLSKTPPATTRLETESEALARFVKDNPDLKDDFNEANRRFQEFENESQRLQFNAFVARDLARSQKHEAEILAQSGQLSTSDAKKLTERAGRLETQAEALARFVKDNPDLKGEFNEANRKYQVFVKDFDDLTEAFQRESSGAPVVLINDKGQIVKGASPGVAQPEPSDRLSPAEQAAENAKFKTKLKNALEFVGKEHALAFEADGSFALTREQSEGVLAVIDKGIDLGDNLSGKLNVPFVIASGPSVGGLQPALAITTSPGKSIKHAGEQAQVWLDNNAGTGAAVAYEILAKPEGIVSLALIVLATGQAALLARSGARVLIRGLGATATAVKSSEQAVRDLIKAARVLGPQRLALAPVSPLFSALPVRVAARPLVQTTGFAGTRLPVAPGLRIGTPGTNLPATSRDVSSVINRINRAMLKPQRVATATARAAAKQVNQQIAQRLRALQSSRKGTVRAQLGSKAAPELQPQSFDFVGVDTPGFALRLAQSRTARAEAIANAKARQQVISQAIKDARTEAATISANPALATTPALDLQLTTVAILEAALARAVQEQTALETGTANSIGSLVTNPEIIRQLQVNQEFKRLQIEEPALSPLALPNNVELATKFREFQAQEIKVSPVALPKNVALPKELRQTQPLAVPKTFTLPEIEALKLAQPLTVPKVSTALGLQTKFDLGAKVQVRQLVRTKPVTKTKVKTQVKVKAPVRVKAPVKGKPAPKPPPPPKLPPIKKPPPPKQPPPKEPPPPKPPKPPEKSIRRIRRIPRRGGVLDPIAGVPAGMFPRRVQWRQGKLYPNLDLETGRYEVRRSPLGGTKGVRPGKTPRQTIKAIKTGPKPARIRNIKMGATIARIRGSRISHIGADPNVRGYRFPTDKLKAGDRGRVKRGRLVT